LGDHPCPRNIGGDIVPDGSTLCYGWLEHLRSYFYFPFAMGCKRIVRGVQGHRRLLQWAMQDHGCWLGGTEFPHGWSCPLAKAGAAHKYE